MIAFLPAYNYTLPELADLISASFAESAEPISMQPDRLARLIRLEQIDLAASMVVTANQKPIGQFLLAVRGERAWCSRLAILPEWRGKSLGKDLIQRVIKQAHDAGATQLTLEVLTENTAALHLYQQAGFQITRSLIDLKWFGKAAAPVGNPPIEDQALPLLQASIGLINTRPAWQRELTALTNSTGLRALALGQSTQPNALLLYRSVWRSAVLVLLAAEDRQAGQYLLQTLQSRTIAIECFNEPTEGETAHLLREYGFLEQGQQYEMQRRV